ATRAAAGATHAGTTAGAAVTATVASARAGAGARARIGAIADAADIPRRTAVADAERDVVVGAVRRADDVVRGARGVEHLEAIRLAARQRERERAIGAHRACGDH